MNQRSIKFRAWDGEKMCRWEDIKRDFGCLLPVEKGEGIMQFTGLLDKNGKEIYEGDILRVNGEVKYEERSGGGYDYGAKWIGFEQDEITPFGEDQIIGNIYENPELLI